LGKQENRVPAVFLQQQLDLFIDISFETACGLAFPTGKTGSMALPSNV
jgi:hypothetical protein